jgi:hypothetical protein
MDSDKGERDAARVNSPDTSKLDIDAVLSSGRFEIDGISHPYANIRSRELDRIKSLISACPLLRPMWTMDTERGIKCFVHLYQRFEFVKMEVRRMGWGTTYEFDRLWRTSNPPILKDPQQFMDKDRADFIALDRVFWKKNGLVSDLTNDYVREKSAREYPEWALSKRATGFRYIEAAPGNRPGRKEGTKEDRVPILTRKLTGRTPEFLGLSERTLSRILKYKEATMRQIKNMIESRAQITRKDLGLPDDFIVD